jgi:hypothetical protein
MFSTAFCCSGFVLINGLMNLKTEDNKIQKS